MRRARCRVYIDIETNSCGKPEPSDEIIAIAVKRDGADGIEVFGIWELGGEGEVLKAFLDYLSVLEKECSNITIIGYNILKFDIPHMVFRAVGMVLANPQIYTGGLF